MVSDNGWKEKAENIEKFWETKVLTEKHIQEKTERERLQQRRKGTKQVRDLGKFLEEFARDEKGAAAPAAVSPRKAVLSPGKRRVSVLSPRKPAAQPARQPAERVSLASALARLRSRASADRPPLSTPAPPALP